MGFDRNAGDDNRQRRALQKMQAAGAAAVHVDAERPTGAVDGVNRVFLLAVGPAPAASLMLFKNGLLMTPGATDDFLLAGGTITFATDQVPQTGDKIVAFYRI